MATVRTTTIYPTVAEFMAAVHPPIPGLTRDEVVSAAHERGVSMVDDIIVADSRSDLANVYFGIHSARRQNA